jgi:hypothetical protein
MKLRAVVRGCANAVVTATAAIATATTRVERERRSVVIDEYEGRKVCDP